MHRLFFFLASICALLDATWENHRTRLDFVYVETSITTLGSVQAICGLLWFQWWSFKVTQVNQNPALQIVTVQFFLTKEKFDYWISGLIPTEPRSCLHSQAPAWCDFFSEQQVTKHNIHIRVLKSILFTVQQQCKDWNQTCNTHVQ